MNLVDQLLFSIETEPENWFQGDHTLNNRDLNIEIWTGNWSRFDLLLWVSPKGKIKFTMQNRMRLWRAIKKWRTVPIGIHETELL